MTMPETFGGAFTSNSPATRKADLNDREAIESLQRAAYAPMAAIAGRPPQPMAADYGEVLANSETWVVDGPHGLAAALILRHEPETTLIWSVAVDPAAQSAGLGRRLLAFAEDRARAVGSTRMRLYTNKLFSRNRAIYRRFGYREVREEVIGAHDPPAIAVHMEKPL